MAPITTLPLRRMYASAARDLDKSSAAQAPRTSAAAAATRFPHHSNFTPTRIPILVPLALAALVLGLAAAGAAAAPAANFVITSGAENTRLEAKDVLTLKPAWEATSLPASAQVTGLPITTDDGALMLVSTKPHSTLVFAMLEADTGAVRWNLTVQQFRDMTTVPGAFIVVSGSSITAYSTKDGSVAWTVANTAHVCIICATVIAAPASPGAPTLFLGTNFDNGICNNVMTGEQHLVRPWGPVKFNNGLCMAAPDGSFLLNWPASIYSANGGNNITKYSLDGSVLATADIGYDNSTSLGDDSVMISADGSVAVATVASSSAAPAGSSWLLVVDMATLAIRLNVSGISVNQFTLGGDNTIFVQRLNSSSSVGSVASISLTDGSTLWETPVPPQLAQCPDFDMAFGGPWLGLYCSDASSNSRMRNSVQAFGPRRGRRATQAQDKPIDPVLVVLDTHTGAVLASNYFDGYRFDPFPMCTLSSSTAARDSNILGNPCIY